MYTGLVLVMYTGTRTHPGFIDDMQKAVQSHDVSVPAHTELCQLIETELKCITGRRSSILLKTSKTARLAGFRSSHFE